MTVPLTYKLLARNGEFTNEITKEANILGWCVEFLQAFFLVADDIMDGSTTRRGKDCWYRKENLGVLAINDAILLESCIYTLLDKYFGDKPYYLNILDAFLYVSFPVLVTYYVFIINTIIFLIRQQGIQPWVSN